MAQDLLPESATTSPVRFFVSVAIWTFLLLVIAYRTGERPRWQWGDDVDSNTKGISK